MIVLPFYEKFATMCYVLQRNTILRTPENKNDQQYKNTHY